MILILFKSYIISAIAAHECVIAQTLQHRNDILFLFGRNTCEYLHSRDDFLQEFELMFKQIVESLY